MKKIDYGGKQRQNNSCCTVPARESERCLHINNFAPVCLRVLRFFLCVPVCLRLLHTKFHRLKKKTFCLRAYEKDRMGSLQYEYKWNHGCEKEPSLQCGPMRSQTSQWRTSELLWSSGRPKFP
jgi:hypothetical protein